MRTPPEIFLVLMSASGVAFSLVSVVMLKMLTKNSDTASAKLKLKAENTAKDFRLLASANALLFVAMLVYLAGALAGRTNIVGPIEWLLIPLSLPPTLVFFRLWRRIR